MNRRGRESHSGRTGRRRGGDRVAAQLDFSAAIQLCRVTLSKLLLSLPILSVQIRNLILAQFSLVAVTQLYTIEEKPKGPP